jgi:hypothetical protein
VPKPANTTFIIVFLYSHNTTLRGQEGQQTCLEPVLRIRIRIGFGIIGVLGYGSRFVIWIEIQEDKNDPQKWKRVNNLIFFEVFSFEG